MFKLGILGYPLHHTLSPVLHTLLLEQVGLVGAYDIIETPPERLAATMEKLKATGYRGVNVTIPHKVAMLDLVDSVTPLAKAVGAINTVTFAPDGSTVGDNTDVPGFVASLNSSLQSTLPERHVVVLGAGGSARAVVIGLLQAKVPSITLVVRSPEKAQDLLGIAQRVCGENHLPTVLQCVTFDALTANLELLTRCGLLVNTTPVGMAKTEQPQPTVSPLQKEPLERLPKMAWVVDLIYRPRQTQLLNDAKLLGLSTQDGLRMLVHQGIRSFELWTSRAVAPEVTQFSLTMLEKHLL